MLHNDYHGHTTPKVLICARKRSVALPWSSVSLFLWTGGNSGVISFCPSAGNCKRWQDILTPPLITHTWTAFAGRKVALKDVRFWRFYACWFCRNRYLSFYIKAQQYRFCNKCIKVNVINRTFPRWKHYNLTEFSAQNIRKKHSGLNFGLWNKFFISKEK